MENIIWKYHHLGDSQVALMVKNPPANAGDTRDMSSVPGSGRSRGEGKGNPLSILARNLTGYSPRGHKESSMTEHSTPSKVRPDNTATTSSISYYSHEQLEEGHNWFFFISPFVPLVSFEMLIGTIFIVTDKIHTQRHLFSCADSPSISCLN